MTVYELKTSVTVSGGSCSTLSLKVTWGMIQQFLVIANTNTTVFRARIKDKNSIVRRNYGFSTGELNDLGMFLPISGQLTFDITNASVNDTFQIVAAIQE
jgi:hypothetical protein